MFSYNFGIMLSPVEFLERLNYSSELLRFL